MTLTATQISFEDYLAYDDGADNRYELVDGKLVLKNPPTVQHFLIARLIEQALDAEIKRLQSSWLVFREAGVRTGASKSRLIDICVVTIVRRKS